VITTAQAVHASTQTPSQAPSFVIEPCRDADQLRDYIDAHWRAGHILARDERMFRFQYQTPWVDQSIFPAGISALCAYSQDSRLLGFLGSIVAPYPRPQSYWLALWHVLPELKGGGAGGRLLQAMQDIAVGRDGRGLGSPDTAHAPDSLSNPGCGWIGTFGAGPEALPVYLKRGYACRAVRRWVFDPDRTTSTLPAPPDSIALHSAEWLPNAEWLSYRFAKHPIFQYEYRAGGVFRTEENSYGLVTHCCRLSGDWRDDVQAVCARDKEIARRKSIPYLMDCWSIDCPGGIPSATTSTSPSGWSLAPDDLPSVFHPPQARGNLIYASGRPFLPTSVQKGDCDQDRPN
jgi:hypothetical protein